MCVCVYVCVLMRLVCLIVITNQQIFIHIWGGGNTGGDKKLVAMLGPRQAVAKLEEANADAHRQIMALCSQVSFSACVCVCVCVCVCMRACMRAGGHLLQACSVCTSADFVFF